MAAPTVLTQNYISWYDLRRLAIDTTSPSSFLVARAFTWDGSVQTVGSNAPADLTPNRLRVYYQGRFLQAIAPS
jgi:hypothetical protein